MKKIALLLMSFVSILGLSQSKSTPVISLNADMTAQLTLDNATSKVTLVLTGPADKWTSLGIGTSSSTTSGDVYVYTTEVTGNAPFSTSPNGEWNTVSNTLNSAIRTVTLERTLTNSDLNDLQMAFDTTNAIDVVWSRSGSAILTAPNPNRGSTTAVFSTNLGLDTISFYDEVIIYPNPTSSKVFIKTKTNLTKVTVYSQTGALVKTIQIDDNSSQIELNINDLPKALYIFELQNETEKTFKKVVLN